MNSDYLKYVVLLVLIASAGCMAFADFSQAHLVYSGAHVLNGEWWRVISAHFVHTNWEHYAMNMTAWLLLVMIFRECFNVVFLSGTILFCCLVISTTYLLMYPGETVYQGYSGVLHGVVVSGAMLIFSSNRVMSVGLLVFITAKLLYEHVLGSSVELAMLIESRVATEAHLAGALSGAVFTAVYLLRRQVRA